MRSRGVHGCLGRHLTGTDISHVIVRHALGLIAVAVYATHPNVIVNGNNRSMSGLGRRLGGLCGGSVRVGVFRIGGPRLSTAVMNGGVTDRVRRVVTCHHTVGVTITGAVHTNTRNVGVRVANHLGNTRVTHGRVCGRNHAPLRAFHTSVSCYRYRTLAGMNLLNVGM